MDDDASEHRLTVGELSAAVVDLRRQQLMSSSISLPSSPYTGRHEDLRDLTGHHLDLRDLAGRHLDHGDGMETSASRDVPDVVPDVRLPLKKRWLYSHQHQDQQLHHHHHHHHQQQSLCAINELESDQPTLSAAGSSCDNVRHG